VGESFFFLGGGGVVGFDLIAPFDPVVFFVGL